MGHLNLAETLAEMGRTAEAEWQFRIATALSPLSTRAHNSYGQFLFTAGRLEDARAEYDRSVRVDPTIDAYDQLGDIYAIWQDEHRAEASFRSAVAFNPFDSHAHFGLGKIFEAQGKPGDALHEAEQRTRNGSVKHGSKGSRYDPAARQCPAASAAYFAVR